MTIKIKTKITATKSYPLNQTKFLTAHQEASKAEKKKFPKGYEKLKKLVYKCKPDELLGHETKGGHIEIEKKVPKSLRKEVVFHEKTEHKNLKRLSKKK